MPDLHDIINGLQEVLPILGTLTGHPEIGVLSSRLLQLGEDELQRRTAISGLSRSEELAEAERTYRQFIIENEAAKKMGHENE